MNNAYLTYGPASPEKTQRRQRGMLVPLLICVMVLAGCASQQPIVVQPKPVTLTPPPPELMEPEVPNLRQRLQQLSGESPETATGPSGN